MKTIGKKYKFKKFVNERDALKRMQVDSFGISEFSIGMVGNIVENLQLYAIIQQMVYREF